MQSKYFKKDEFKCKHTGDNFISERLISRLDVLREACGFPLVVVSGYRSPKHPIEAAKSTPGTHTRGIAVDLRVRNGIERMKLVSEAIRLGFTGIGVAKSFVHLDIRDDTPVMWLY
jgi:zinc D-Ala-D-Ala carboxypeptidase